MPIKSHHGRCPSCQAEGVVGHACDRRACREAEIHLVPDRFASGTRRDPRVGRVVGHHLLVERVRRPDADQVYRVVQLPALLEGELTLVLPERDPLVHKALYREALALARVWHPHIERLIYFGVDPLGTFLVTDFAGDARDARTLGDFLGDQAGVCTPPEAARLLLAPLTSALMSLAAAEMVHGEIRPEHILVRELPGIPVFVQLGGFVRVPRDGGERGRAPRELVWSAPEQIERQATNPTTDLYAVTAIAYAIVFGHTPFPDDDRPAVLAAKRDPGYDPLARLREPPPTAVATFFAKALARAPEARFSDAARFGEAVSAMLTALERSDVDMRFDELAPAEQRERVFRDDAPELAMRDEPLVEVAPGLAEDDDDLQDDRATGARGESHGGTTAVISAIDLETIASRRGVPRMHRSRAS